MSHRVLCPKCGDKAGAPLEGTPFIDVPAGSHLTAGQTAAVIALLAALAKATAELFKWLAAREKNKPKQVKMTCLECGYVFNV